jgi:TIR domain
VSRGQIDVFISEDIPRGNEWRPSIEKHLRDGQSLFLIYGAPYEDWSWCSYEAGYFAALNPPPSDRLIFCLIRPDVTPPSPLSHLQMVTSKSQLIKELIEIFQRNAIEFDAVQLRGLAGKLERGLFGEIRQFDGYPRVHFVASDTEFANGEIPATAVFTGDDNVLGDLFTIQASSVPWGRIHKLAHSDTEKQNFIYKWLEETAQIILAARENQSMAPQTVLIGRGGRRYRTLLHYARIQGDGTYCCEFLAILTREIYKSLGLGPDGKTVVGPGLTGPDVERHRTAFNAMRLLNIEFLSRCCARVSQMMKRSKQELSANAKALEDAVRALANPDLKSAA